MASDGFAICAVSRHWHFIVGDWTSSSLRNGANRKRLAIFPYRPHAVALLRLPVTVNKVRVFPQPLATTYDAETRDLGLKTHRDQCYARHPDLQIRGLNARGSARHPNHTPAVAHLSVPLAASGQGTMCTLLTVADIERARPREMVTARMAKFD